MSANLITGNGFSPITASMDADFQSGIVGDKTVILPIGSNMALSIEDANTIKADDGVIITKEGRRIQIDNGAIEEWTIPTGTQGTTKYYIVGFHIYTDDEANELIETFVEKVDSASSTITENTLRGGATEVYISVGRVKQIGVNLDSVTPLLTVAKSIADYEQEIAQINNNLTDIQINRWLRPSFSNHKALVIKSGSSVKLANGSIKTWSADTVVTFSSLTNGTDYFVFVDNNGNVTCSTNATPSSTQVKIGRFHTLCANVGNISMIAPASPSSGLTVGDKYLVKSYKEDIDPDFYAHYNKTISAVTVQSKYDVITMPHPLSGYLAGDIIPESVFCLSWKPDCLVEDAMVYDKDTDRCVDIYLQSGTGFNTRSAYNKTHTVNREAYNHAEDYRMVGKRLLRDCEFTSCALGSNERTNIQGSSDKTTVGGHVDTNNRRMISAIGCEEMCGYIWQWLDEVSPHGGSGWGTTDGHGSFGQEYGTPYVLLAGGSWNYGASCGSRSRDSASVRSAVGADISGRGSSHITRGYHD